MAEGSRWSSSRLTHIKSGQPSSQSSGSQQSRWATNGSTNDSSNNSNSSSSSWRSSPSDSTASLSSYSTHRIAPVSRGNGLHSTNGASTSRWATQPSRPSPSEDASVSTLADTLSKTSVVQPPSIYLSTSVDLSQHQSVPRRTVRSDGLQPRSASRPLGGKSLDRLALLASPSRGLDSTSSISTELSSQGSMDLTSSEVQHEFREYISTRIRHKAIPLLCHTPALKVLDPTRYLPHAEASATQSVSAGEEELQQVVLLVRKLREALVASKRIDPFAVEVYELSAFLAVICGDVPQLAATLPRLVLELYPDVAFQEEEAGLRDVVELATHLGLSQTSGKGEERRMRLVSLHLLQTLCLSGRASRLGQYASGSESVVEPLHRGLSEYRNLRTAVSGLYGTILAPHLILCDTLYSALRDIDPFTFSQLLDGHGGYKVDGWQRLVMLQAVPLVRGAAWAIAKKSYMYVPISGCLAGMIRGDGVEEEGGRERYLAQMLLLSTDILPQLGEKRVSRSGMASEEQEVPEEWDVESSPSDPPDADHGARDHLEEDKRVHEFLTLQFTTTLQDRLMKIKEGHAVKIR